MLILKRCLPMSFISSMRVYSLVGLQVACGTMGMPTATVRLRGPDGTTQRRQRSGPGRWMRLYKAMDAIIQAPNTLLEFSVHSVTEGIDALEK